MISAVATDVTMHSSLSFMPGIDDEPDPGEGTEDLDDPSLLVDLDPLPPLAGGGGGPTGLTRRQQKEALRDANADLARALVARTGLTHAQVNAEMNRLAGVSRVSEATLEQLQKRLDKAEAWYQKVGLRR